MTMFLLQNAAVSKFLVHKCGHSKVFAH